MSDFKLLYFSRCIVREFMSTELSRNRIPSVPALNMPASPNNENLHQNGTLVTVNTLSPGFTLGFLLFLKACICHLSPKERSSTPLEVCVVFNDFCYSMRLLIFLSPNSWQPRIFILSCMDWPSPECYIISTL